jgi:hypothetical protein
MEFLMTYGWSVLIIMAVIVALFQLGVFSPTNYTPKAQPGNCKVLRTGGFTNLEGTCSGVPPQSVAVFNGGSSYINIGSSGTLSPANAVTMSAWVNTQEPPTQLEFIGGFGNTGSSGYWLGIGDNGNGEPDFSIGNSIAGSQLESSSPLILNHWYLITGTYNGINQIIYVNGVQAATSSTETGSISYSGVSSLWIGQISGSGGLSTRFFNGLIADVQIYNTTLDASQVLLLYTRGIGAAPIAPQSVVGWWPLNGNANDYSGNNNNGASTNVIYTSSWTSGYTAP